VADKPDGKQRNERITFTRPAAERIAKVVRQVEGGDRDSSGLTFRRVPPQSPGGSEVRFALWTATTNWLVVSPRGVTTTNNTKVVQFAFPLETALNGTNVVTFSAGPTVHCINHLARIQRRATSTTSSFALQTLVIAREAGQWRLIGAEC
jgi:hypothetical protein